MWDDEGDTYIYYGYQRPTPAFRVKSSILRETKSDELVNKLRDGYRKEPPAFHPSPHAEGKGITGIAAGIKGLSFGAPICHEIHFPAPSSATSRLDILRHHITTRNLFALLLGNSLVGLTFYQALVDLQERCEDLMPGVNSAQMIIRMLVRLQLHNVSNDPAGAAGLLAWSEDNFWLDGWREGYVHCVGMYPQARQVHEFRDISHETRTLLERSSAMAQAQFGHAQSQLSTLAFSDLFSARNETDASLCVSFRSFLIRYLEKQHRCWPPRTESGLWLGRTLLSHLQRDFRALYKLLVNHDISWDTSDTFLMRADVQVENTDELSIERRVSTYDEKSACPHIPMACPLLPQISVSTEKQASKPAFSFLSRGSKGQVRRGQMAAIEANNASRLGNDVMSNPLVEAFLKFEKSDRSSADETEARAARKARWLLLYAILQTLSQASVVTPNLAFPNEATYPLYADLTHMPPWQPDSNVFTTMGTTDLHAWLRTA